VAACCVVWILFPAALHSIAKVEALDCVGEVAHEVRAAKLPIRKNIETNLLLALKNTEDFPIFKCLQLMARKARLARIKQRGGAQETADMVRAI
jgi:hypothetical protein